jgi:hypothetical protein
MTSAQVSDNGTIRNGLIGRPHINGGGWVADRANVAAKVFVGAKATIWGGTIRGGTISGGTIWGGTIEGGTIRGGTISGGTIRGGTISGGTIWGGTIEGGTIRGGTIRGGTIRGGTISGGTISGGTIKGSRDVLVVGPIGSENQLVTLVRTVDSHLLGVGCWFGHTVDELAAEVQDRCPDRAAEYAEIELVLRRRIAEWAAE